MGTIKNQMKGREKFSYLQKYIGNSGEA